MPEHQDDRDQVAGAERFAIAYAERSGLALGDLLTRRHVVECGPSWGCDDPSCEGFAMVPLDAANTRGIDALGSAVLYPPDARSDR